MKGIQAEIGEMKIKFPLDVKLVNHSPYHLNPQVKEKFKKEID
jgi:hypothetical protein